MAYDVRQPGKAHGSPVTPRPKRLWSRLSLTHKGVAIMLLALVPMALAGALQLYFTVSVRRLDAQVLMDRGHRLDQARLMSLLVDAETSVRGYLLTADESFLEPYENARARIPELLRRMEEHSGESGHGRELEEIPGLVERKFDVMAGLVRSGNSEDDLREGRIVMDAISARVADLAADEDARIQNLLQARDDEYRREQRLLAAGALVALLASAGAGMILLRGIVRRVQVVRANAQRLADGRPLEALPPSRDDIAQLDALLSQSANLLRARESALRQAKEEADRANSAKSVFLSRMSHELRTPLNAILGFTELARAEVRGEVRGDLDQIHLAGRHLLDLINEVLDISRIEAGHMSLSLESVSVPEVVTEAMALVRGAAAARGIRVRSECSESVFVRADRQRLKQVLVNLLSNGVKYNHDAGGVVVSCVTMGRSVRVVVTDTGPGLPKGAAEKLFTPFARLGAETSEIEGTGLGLALSKNLIEAMGGEMDVGTSGPAGTEFWFSLALDEAPSVVEAVQEAPLAAVAPDRSPATVLQVEDNPSNIKLVARIMQRRPWIDLVTAQLGADALEVAKRVGPDLVLLDLNLPDMSGREVLARLRSDPDTRDIQVVMLSADATGSQVQSLLDAGAAGYLTKPIDVASFLEVVDEVLAAQAA
ncbi:MAG TPA: ATP-binding protein [Actinomycetota bacterium]|nr:ATP-binding protein [Actinomycetota bacterium]